MNPKSIIGLFFLTFGFSLDLQAQALCVEGLVSQSICQVPTGYYVYSNEFGGRSTASNLIIENLLEGIVPPGWYQDQQIEFRDTQLKDYNIRNGINIFGVTGIATAGSFLNSCNLNSGIIDSSCLLQPNRYYYNNEKGGRSLNCPIFNGVNINADQPCWLNDSDLYLNLQALNQCPLNQELSVDCRASVDQYYYSSAFNGRGSVCSVGESLSSSCWIDFPASEVASGNCSLGLNSASCVTNTGSTSYVYSTAFGGRGVNCANNNSGNCWFNSATKAGASAGSLVAGNIKSGVSIFGVNGTFTGATVEWSSSIHKNTNTLPAFYLVTEQTQSATLSTNLHEVPKVSKSHEGGIVDTGAITLLNRSGWTNCGTTGTLAERITNCNHQWAGGLLGNGGQGTWDLVTRNNTTGLEVWRDKSTNLLWSSRVASATNWCRASGSSNSLNSVVSAELKEADPAGICSNSLFQNNGVNDSVYSACSEEFSGFQMAPEQTADGKVGLRTSNSSSNGKVRWRLPTIYDYALANKHGLRFVLPDAGPIGSEAQEWTATTVSNSVNRQNAFLFNSRTGARSQQIRSANAAVRCVGR